MSHGLRDSFHAPRAGQDPGLPIDVLAEMCTERFQQPRYEVRRDDERRTVWVSVDGGELSVGLQPHMVARRGFSAVVDDAEAKLSRAVRDDRRSALQGTA